jgi:hypothetical protein
MASNTYRGLVDDALTALSGIDRWRYFRQKMWERDGGLCGFCGEPVPCDALDLDHVRPQRDGGLATWDNLRTAHPHCNRTAGAKLGHAARPRIYDGTPVPWSVRIPVSLHTTLKAMAAEEDRSLHNLMLRILRAEVNRRAGPPPPAA